MVQFTGPMASQGGVIARTDTPVFQPEIWDMAYLRYLAREMPMRNYVQVGLYAGKKAGVLHKPYIGRLQARRRVPGVPLTYETKREGEWQMRVDRNSYAAFAVDGILDFTNEVDLARAYTPSIADALLEDVEYGILAERATFKAFLSTANANDTNNIESTNPITYANILTAIEILMMRNVAPKDMLLFVGPRQFMTMFTINEFIQSGVFNSGNIADISSGTIVGTVMGVRVVLNQNIRENSTTGLVLGGNDYFDTVNGERVATPGMLASPYYPTQWGSDHRVIADINTGALTAGYTSALLTTADSIALAMPKSPNLEMEWDMDYQATKFASTQFWDVKTVDPRLGVVINTDETNEVA